MDDATKNEAPSKPRPYVNPCKDPSELAWDPVALEQYTLGADGSPVRAGDSFAIVRPGHERWPLGHASDVYVPTSHRRTVSMVKEACGLTVQPSGRPLMSGHGYQVAHAFSAVGESIAEVGGKPFRSRLVIVHDHTGMHALKARMVCYVGDDALGSIVGARAIHVAENPQRWRVEIESMVERTAKAQGAVLKLIAAASKLALSEADKAQLTAYGVTPARGQWQSTLLESMIAYMRGSQSRSTWGVWSRRLQDDAVVAMVKILGRKEYGSPLDEALGGRRYGG